MDIVTKQANQSLSSLTKIRHNPTQKLTKIPKHSTTNLMPKPLILLRARSCRRFWIRRL